VKKEGNGSRIILTRCGELFLRKVLELEIPEIKEQIIVIRDILTFPGFLNKVIIESKNPYLNVVGTCIGKDACRMRSILPTIYPERMEMIKWEENKEKLFFKLLAPVEVIKLVENGND
jgi:N utilization substance protein A